MWHPGAVRCASTGRACERPPGMHAQREAHGSVGGSDGGFGFGEAGFEGALRAWSRNAPLVAAITAVIEVSALVMPWVASAPVRATVRVPAQASAVRPSICQRWGRGRRVVAATMANGQMPKSAPTRAEGRPAVPNTPSETTRKISARCVPARAATSE